MGYGGVDQPCVEPICPVYLMDRLNIHAKGEKDVLRSESEGCLPKVVDLTYRLPFGDRLQDGLEQHRFSILLQHWT